MQSKDNIISIIDIGTNTCLLLIAHLKEKNLIKLFEAQETPRLGNDLYKTGYISKKTFPKALTVIKNYIDISEKYNAQKILAFGTSALREANNSSEFIEFIKRETDIKIKILSEELEAKYGYEGAIFDFDKTNEYSVVDIGGGSTEISFKQNSKLNSMSLKIGSVRLYEKFFHTSFDEVNINQAIEFIQKDLEKLEFDIKDKVLIGVAGTMTTLSAIKNHLIDFKEEKIHKDKLTLSDIECIFNQLKSMSEKERLNIGSFMIGRSDIIICGTLILLSIMNHFKIDLIVVSTKGLRYGLMLNVDDFF